MSSNVDLTYDGDLYKLTNFQGRVTPKEVLFKFLIIGDYGVGKTAIARRYTEDRFSQHYKLTIGADFSMKMLSWDEETNVTLQLWDIAGHERFGNMTRVYYKYAVAAAVVFDLSRPTTFQSVEKWLVDLRMKVTLPDGSPIPVVLLANKCDIEGAEIPVETIVRFCRDNNVAAWFVTSAKENINIGESMSFLVHQVIQAKHQQVRNDSISLSDSIEQVDNGNGTMYCCH